METIKFQHRPDGDIDAAYFFNKDNEKFKSNILRIIKGAEDQNTWIRDELDNYVYTIICRDLGIPIGEEEDAYLDLSSEDFNQVLAAYEAEQRYKDCESQKKSELAMSCRYIVSSTKTEGREYSHTKIIIDTQTGERIALTNIPVKSIKIYDAPGAWGGLSDDRYLAYYSFNPQNP